MNDVANIDLPYVEKNPRKSGTLRYFLRINGKRICRLPDDINSEEFARAYWKARNAAMQESLPEKGTLGHAVRPNSFRWLCLHYMKSNAFTRLDNTTRNKRRAIIESMWLEPLSKTDDRIFADMPYKAMDIGNIEVLRDRKKETPFAADERLKILRQVFDVRINGTPVTANVARLVEPFKIHTDGHATAKPADMAQYISHHGTQSKAVLAGAILMFTGLRVSDLAVLGPQHRRGDSFHLRLFKGRNNTPVGLVIPIHPILEAVLAIHNVRDLTYIVTDFGKPFSVKGLGKRISDWFRQADLEGLTAHSIRKGLATDVAHNEASEKMMEGLFGWSEKGRTSQIYTRNAERARLARAAVAKINWDGIGSTLLPGGDKTQGVAGCGNRD